MSTVTRGWAKELVGSNIRVNAVSPGVITTPGAVAVNAVGDVFFDKASISLPELDRKLAENRTQSKLLDDLTDLFELEAPPQRIEVYDNSHIQGTNAVGAMIVAGPDGFMKNQYRKFNIRSTDITPGDDFGMMKEVMQRRFSRLMKEHAEGGEIEEGRDAGFPAWPDVILIDGGQGQMTTVRAILAELGVDERVVAIGVAKGQDREAGNCPCSCTRV